VYPTYDNYNGQTHNGSLRVHTGEGNRKIPNHQALRLCACDHVHATAGPLLNIRCTGTAGNKMPVTIAKAFTITRGWSGMAHGGPLAFPTFFTIHLVGDGYNSGGPNGDLSINRPGRGQRFRVSRKYCVVKTCYLVIRKYFL